MKFGGNKIQSIASWVQDMADVMEELEKKIEELETENSKFEQALFDLQEVMDNRNETNEADAHELY